VKATWSLVLGSVTGGLGLGMLVVAIVLLIIVRPFTA